MTQVRTPVLKIVQMDFRQDKEQARTQIKVCK